MTEQELKAIEERAGPDVGPYPVGTSAGWQEAELYQYEKDIRALGAEVRRLSALFRLVQSKVHLLGDIEGAKTIRVAVDQAISGPPKSADKATDE